MDTYRLNELKKWFDAYSARFFDADTFVNSHLQLKRDHTRRTCEEILYLAARLRLNENQRRIAEAIALLHDIGRFSQFATYRTFNDAKSVNHGDLGAEVLRREAVLESLDPEERLWVETSVARHGQKSLPENLSGQPLLFLKLIRDADKLDIWRFAVACYRNGGYPAGILLEFPDQPEVSIDVVRTVLAERLVDYARLRTLSDFRLCQIGWIYDMNFAASLERLEAGNLIEGMFAILPGTPEISELHRKIRLYIESRLAGDGVPQGVISEVCRSGS